MSTRDLAAGQRNRAGQRSSRRQAPAQHAGNGAGHRLRRRDYRGWHMVWALSATETVAFGALYYSFAVFLVPMRDAFDASPAALTGAFSVALAVSGLAAPLVGRWLDRYGARVVMTVGSAAATIALVAWSAANNLPQLYLAFILMGLAWAGVQYEPAFALINRWFDRDRQSALLTLTMVGGLASVIFVPLSQLLISILGWREALLVLAAVAALCGVVHLAVLRAAPASVGLAVDGAPRDAAPVETPPCRHTQRGPSPEGRGRLGEPAAGVGSSWRLPQVRWLTLATVAETAAVTIIAVHLVSYLQDSGSGPGTAAAAAGSLGIMSIAGRIFLTRAAARWSLARVTAGIVGAQALGVAALHALPRPADIVVFVVVFGAGFGVMTLARAALLGRYVPGQVFGRVSGRQALVVNAGRVAAPVAAGASITWTGDYAVLLISVALCTLAAAVALWRSDMAFRGRDSSSISNVHEGSTTS
ncbi:MFS transporter [Arthrobacter sulfonylureivorans]|uniref:MFS transporter n=1 Tax=Arthrobacter sulfonylureivorans TaxID=2486855 RepID=A0ABY3WBT5_9MICC|nr:MFS transporter [Arthrobacter sulfonylureivorans]UNK47818.1 MFS transporter [Arthrobacter sulfonylureivorans]